ncbi:MAG TPA: hypothetical protein VFR70_10975 [Flavobacterium sp.]|nr:hypothetical protein [Flavobacterium sp.]
MEEKLKQIIAKLEKSLQESAEGNDIRFHLAFSYSFLDQENTPDRQLKSLEAPLEGVAAILQLMERYPDIYYFYEPNYLCFYLEHYCGQGYEQLLLQSVRHNPITYTIYLLERIMYDKGNPHCADARELLAYIAKKSKYPEAIRQDAAKCIARIEEQENSIFIQNLKPETLMDTDDFYQKAARINERIRQQIALKASSGKTWQDILPDREMITMDEAVERFSVLNHYWESKYPVLLLNGDVCVAGNLDGAWVERQLESMDLNDKQQKSLVLNNYTVVIAITGNLTVENAVIDDDWLQLTVAGNLTCDYVHSKNGVIQIEGSASITYGVYGYYNDGLFEVDGKVFAPYLIAHDHCMPRSAEGDFIYVEGGNGTEKENIEVGRSEGSGIAWDWYYYENSAQLFSPKVWDEQEEFSVDNFFGIVRNGENPFIDPKNP